MTDRHTIDPAQAAQITDRIDQVFEFVRDAIDDPWILEEIPSGSTLRFRDVVYRGRPVHLTAFRPKLHGARWGARISSAISSAGSGSPPGSRPVPLLRRGERWPSVGGYHTAEAALDALEAEIRDVKQPEPVTRRAVGE